MSLVFVTLHSLNISQLYLKARTLLAAVQYSGVMEKLCDHLDVSSIASLEQCCHLLRDLVVENKVYRRKVSSAIRGGGWSSGGWLRKKVEDPTEREISNFFKAKLLKKARR